jgi:CubicO group peptidase (beta-lactamase class C family)
LQMASNTKAVIATAVLILAERGKVDLDAEVGKCLPAFDNEKCRGMKVRHLLSHISGLRLKTLFVEPLMKLSPEHPDAPNLQLEVSRIGDVGFTEPPGQTYSYSNAGYNTLGALIEVLSGTPLEAFLTAEIYQPLGMLESSNHPDPAETSRMAVVYAREKNGWKIRFNQDSPPKAPFVRGSGGMISTAADFARFCQMFLNGGVLDDRRILSRESVRMATSPQTPPIPAAKDEPEKKTFYGFGWSLFPDGIFAHGGSEGTYAWIDPKRQLIVLVLTQSPGSIRPRQQFIELVTNVCIEEPI